MKNIYGIEDRIFLSPLQGFMNYFVLSRGCAVLRPLTPGFDLTPLWGFVPMVTTEKTVEKRYQNLIAVSGIEKNLEFRSSTMRKHRI